MSSYKLHIVNVNDKRIPKSLKNHFQSSLLASTNFQGIGEQTPFLHSFTLRIVNELNGPKAPDRVKTFKVFTQNAVPFLI